MNEKKIASDKRQLLIKLTDKGKSQQHDIYQAISQCVSEQMNLQEYQEAKDIMDKLELSLKNIVS